MSLFLNHKKLKFNEISHINNSPLYIAIFYRNIEVASELINHPKVDVNAYSNNYKVFEVAIEKDLFTIGDLLLLSPLKKFLTERSYNVVNINRTSISDEYYYDRDYGHIEKYSQNLARFFLQKSSNEKVAQKQKEIVNCHKTFFTCLIARYLNEKEFVQFTNDYQVDKVINKVVKGTIFNLIFSK